MAKTGKSLSAFLAALFLTICLLPVMGSTAYAAPAKRYVRYDANGGENAPTRQIKKKDEPLQIAAARPTREGYTFVCWDTVKSGGGTLYYPGSEYRTDRDLKLYAQWKPKTCVVVFYANGGRDAPKSQVKEPWETITLTAEIPTRTGYTFLCWNTKIDGTGTDYHPGQNYDARDSAIIYAVWQPVKVWYRFDPNGGTFSKTGVHFVKIGATVRIPKTAPRRPGYTFLEWNTQRDGSGETYLPGFHYAMETCGTLYAQWKRN